MFFVLLNCPILKIVWTTRSFLLFILFSSDDFHLQKKETNRNYPARNRSIDLFLFTQSYWETTQRGVLLLNNTSRQYSKNESNEKSFNLFSSGLQIRERYYCCPPQFLVKRMYTSAEGT